MMNRHIAPHATGTEEPVAADYLPQLDGLRAITVLAVMFHHFILDGPWGHWGVYLFFVLSGFLITRLLIDARDKCLGLGRPRWFAFRQFYVRRFLRIFPVYYVGLAVAIAVDLPNAAV